jgi:hypothetical protein
MMTCRQIENELSAFVDGELTDAVRAEVQAHLAGCERCRRRLAELERLSDGVARLPRLEATPRFVLVLFRRLRAGEEPRRSWADFVFRPLWLKLPVEAIAVLAVAVGVMFLSQREPKRQACVCEAVKPASPGPTPVPAPAAAPMERIAAAHLLLKQEAVVLVSANPSGAEQRVTALVKKMDGELLEVKHDDGAARKIRVRLPIAMVSKFKTEVAEVPAARPLGRRAMAFADEARKAETESAGKAKEKPMTELEVQIVAPVTERSKP